MAENIELNKPWLVAAWPGLGSVAIGAVAHLVNTLGMQSIEEIPGSAFFEIEHVEIQGGVVRVPRLAQTRVFAWKNPTGGRDLLVAAGETQPRTGGFAMSERILHIADRYGAERVVTFAALATQLHPLQDPGVHKAVTDPALLAELKTLDVPNLAEGQIGGLNGVFLAAALERAIPGICLLAEIPYFAAGVPSPKASAALLRVFSQMSGIELDLADLEHQGEAVAQGLLEMLERMKRAQASEEGEEQRISEPSVGEEQPGEEEEEAPKKDALPLEARRRIEELFEEARRDKSKAVRLKEELDRFGVFDRYEDRFLDLFRRAE